MNAQPTTPATITVSTQELSFDVPQITNFQDAWFNEYTENRRKIAAAKYLERVANSTKGNCDTFILSALYEIMFYISNGLFEAFEVVKGSVTAKVFIQNEKEFYVTIQTPTQYFKFCDDKELFFLKFQVKTFEKLVGAKVVKQLKAEMPVETPKVETSEVFEIGKSSVKKLSATQIKTYSEPKKNKATYSNVNHPYWKQNIIDGQMFFVPVNAVDIKINTEYFEGFKYFAWEYKNAFGSKIIVSEKSTGCTVVDCLKSELTAEIKRIAVANQNNPLSEIIERQILFQPFTIEQNETIESINTKRIAQNEIYVFGTTNEVEPIAETIIEPIAETNNFDNLSGIEKSFAKNYVNAELKTRNAESLVLEFETALLTCKESDKLSYHYALNLLTTMQATTQPTNEPNNQAKTMQPTPTPQPEITKNEITNETIKLANERKDQFLSIKYLFDMSDRYKGTEKFNLADYYEKQAVESCEILSQKLKLTYNTIINLVFDFNYEVECMQNFLVENSQPQPELTDLSNVSNTELDYMIRFFPTQKEVGNYDSHTEKTHISALAEKNKRQGEELKEILAKTPQPEPLTVGQVIQGDGYRLVVTAVKEPKQVETQEPIQKSMIPTQRTYTEFWTGERFTMYQDNYTKNSCLIGKNGETIKNFIISNSASYRFWDKSEITMKDGQFFELSSSNPITHRKCWNQKRFIKIK